MNFRRSVCLLAILAAPALRSAVPDGGQEQFRRLVRLPTVSMSFGFSFTARDGLSLLDETADPEPEIAAIRKELKGDASDAERYLALQRLLRRAGDPAATSNACFQAMTLFRRRVVAQPEDIAALTGLGEALSAMAEDEESESVLRQATRLGPRDHRAWIALGVQCEKRAGYLLIWKAYPAAAKTGTGPFGAVSPFEMKPAPSDLAEGMQRLNEATDCFNRAVDVAPRNADVYARRAAHKSQRHFLTALMRHHRGESPGPFDAGKAVFTAEMLPDLDEVVRLDSQNYLALGSAGMVELLLPLVEKEGPPGDQGRPPLELLSDAERRRVNRVTTRLEELGRGGDPRVAAGALESLAMLQKVMEADPDLIVRNLRRAVALDLTREKAWDLLTTTLAAEKSFSQLKAVCEERVRRKASPRNLLMLAKALDKLEQWDKASEVIERAVKKEPENFACRTAQAALLLKRSSDEKSLDDAGRILSRVAAMLEKSGGAIEPPVAANFLMNASLYHALSGDRARARDLAGQAARITPDDPDVKAVLAAVSR